MSKKSKNSKSKIKQPKAPIFSADDYAQVLQELGPTVECGAECGQGALVMIKPALKEGCKVILTRTLYFEGPNDKELFDEISKLIKSDDDWETWQV